jgi:hypothetical protein
VSFHTYFLASSFAFLSVGFLAMLITGRLDPVSPLLYAGVVVLAWRLERHQPQRLLHTRTAVWLSALSVPLAILDGLLLSRSPFLALAHFTLYLSSVKLLQTKADSDWIWLYALTFGEMLLAASLTVDETFLVSLIVFLLFFFTTLAAFEIERSHRSTNRLEEETCAMRGDRARGLGRVRYLSATAVGQLVMVLVIAVPIFFLMPRFTGGALGAEFSTPQMLTGFSSTVRLGEVGNVKQSAAVVMGIHLPRPAPRWLRWRGVVLDQFDGQTWRSGVGRGRAPVPVRPDAQGRIYTYSGMLPAAAATGRLFEQKVYLEPVGTQAFFAANRLQVIETDFKSATVDLNDCVLATSTATGRRTYTAYSDVSVPSDAELQADASTAYPKAITDWYLQMPPLDPRFGELATRVVGDARTPFEKAKRIEQYLKHEFTYTLKLQRHDTGIDPVSDFVLNSRAGHCEYFASAMVLMLRSQGVPARLVNGFQMGEYNPLGDVYVVRQLDAHSWVDVYFAGGRRWIEFDPTPAAGFNAYGGEDFGAQVRRAIEALHLFWVQYVITLDDREQIALIRSAQRQLLAFRAWAAETLREGRKRAVEMVAATVDPASVSRRSALTVAAGLMAVGGVALLLFVLHERGWVLGGLVLPVWRLRAPWRRRTAAASAVAFYDQMCAILARLGYVRALHQTPREFSRDCGIPEVEALTELYHRARYGQENEESVRSEAARLLALLARGKKPSRANRMSKD